MIILIITEFFFHIIRSLFIGYIVKRFLNQSWYGLFAIILYYLYYLIPSIIPFFNMTSIVLRLIPMIITIIMYMQLFQMTSFRMKKKLTSVSLDIYTLWYEQYVLRIISVLLMLVLILFQMMSGPIHVFILILLMILIIGYNVYQTLQDKHTQSHIVIRLGKEFYNYEVKTIPVGLKIFKYQDFFQSQQFVLDKIATISYIQDQVKRLDYIYAVKADATFQDQGFKRDQVPYVDVLDTLKHYQLVKVNIKYNQTNIKRLK